MHARFDGVIVLVVLTLGGFGVFDPAGSAGGVTQRTYGGSFDLSIPADPGASMGWMADAVIDVPDHFVIRDLDVGVTLTHTSVYDLQLFLYNPAGGVAILNYYNTPEEFFKGADYSGTVFDDEASTFIKDASTPFTGRFRPIDSLSVFDGQDAFGSWRLRIYDVYKVDTGHLDAFTLSFTGPSTVPAPGSLMLGAFGLSVIRLSARRRVRRSLLGDSG